MESNAVYLCKLVNIPFILISIPKLDLSRFNAAYLCVNWFFYPHYSIFRA